MVGSKTLEGGWGAEPFVTDKQLVQHRGSRSPMTDNKDGGAVEFRFTKRFRENQRLGGGESDIDRCGQRDGQSEWNPGR